jgi:hypothetical protein
MALLHDEIYSYYLQHFGEMPEDKQFHFASRLYLWSQDSAAKQLLNDLRPYFTNNDQPEEALQQLYVQATESPTHGSKNASELRAPYFEKYPKLKTHLLLLFRLCFLESIYDINVREKFFELCPPEELREQFLELASDPKAVAILSTHAINFAYLYTRVAMDEESLFDPADYIDIAHNNYELTDKIHLQLLIYLYTHCIIGDSRFYARAVPETYLATYRQMVDELEALISDNYDDINLDNKCEFLVCAKMVGVSSSLETKIFDEASKSVSDEGTFVIDKLNNNPQITNTSLDKSEHRNVLYIMANRPFTPLT